MDKIRNFLENIILDYEEEKIKISDLYDKAEDFSEDLFEDYPKYSLEDPRYIPIRILCFLESFRDLLPEDIKIIKKYLNTPKGEEKKAHKEWDNYWEHSSRN
jgi:hypothetical protein